MVIAVTLPTVGGSSGSWGTTLNTDLTALSAAATDASVASAIAATTTNTQTASYTLALVDAGAVVEMNVATANNLTIPLNASVAFPIGTLIEVNQTGAGQTTVVATGGVTLHNTSSVTTRVQWASVALRKRGTDEWVLTGDLT